MYSYVVNNGNNSRDIYYYNNGAIVKRRINNDVKEKAEIIVDEVREYFAVTIRLGKPVLIYRRINGDVMMLAGGESRLLQKGNNRDTEIYLNTIMADRRMRLIYINNGSLVTQSSDEQGGNDAIRLDSICGSLPYRLIPLVRGGYALIYNRHISDMQLGYREVTASSIGDFKKLYNTGFDIGDSSMCAADDTLHIVFVSMSRFAVRVMYVKRTNEGLSKPKNLWEGSKCDNVCIACDGCDVFVWWQSNGNIFENVSNNCGDSFGQSVRRIGKETYKKALYLSDNSYNISELMLSANGDIYAPMQVKELIARQNVSPVIAKDVSEVNSKKVNNNITALVAQLKAEIDKKQQQIDNLSHTIRIKGEESNRTEYMLRQQCKSLKEEIDRLKNNKASDENA